MFTVKPFRGSSRQEELTSVSILSRVGHGEQSWNFVRDELWWFSPFVVKFLAVDGLSPSSVRICKVSALFLKKIRVLENFFHNGHEVGPIDTQEESFVFIRRTWHMNPGITR